MKPAVKFVSPKAVPGSFCRVTELLSGDSANSGIRNTLGQPGSGALTLLVKIFPFLRCWSSATSFIKCPAPTSIPAPSSLDHLHMCALWHFSCSAVWCSQTLLDSQLCKDRDYVLHSNLLFICSLTWRVRVCGSHFKNCRVSPGSPAASSVI